ncbi:MAG: TMEM43 family protein [Planctomycetota bacterium]
MKNAIIGVFIGILMIPGSVIVLGWNEYRTIHRTQGLQQGAELVETVSDPNSVNSSLNESLVHLTAQANTEEQLQDDEFAVQAQAIQMRRNVEMYQWVEKTKTRKKKKLGGGEERVTEYSYVKKWEDGREDSDSFEEKAGHENPPQKFTDQSFVAEHVTVGAYELNDVLVSQIIQWEKLPWDAEKLENVDSELKDQILLSGNHVYWSETGQPDPENPNIGDQRIQFEVVNPTQVSLVAQQVGNSFDAYTVPNGEQIQQLYVGEFTAEKMFERFQQENIVLAWVLRVIGLVVCCVGFFLIMSPLAVFSDIIPFLGSMTRGLAFFVAALLGVCVSATTIAVAWIAVRPLIGIPLLIVAIGSIYMVYRLFSKAKSSNSNPASGPNDDIPYVPMAN